MRFKINYTNIPVLAIGFSRSSSLFAKGIQLVRGILGDKSEPNHAFFVTEDHGQLFATEETIHGLVENSLEEYTGSRDRIVAMYIWEGFNDASKREDALKFLAEVRRKRNENSRYDFKGLLSFVPVLKKFFKPDPKRQWCSENVASLLNTYGAGIGEEHITPDQLLKIVQEKSDFKAVLGYYI